MPTVPKKQEREILPTATTPIFTTSAGLSALSFGQGGEGLINFAEVLGNISAQLQVRSEEEAEEESNIRAKKLELQFANKRRDLLYGENGFYGLRGFNAVEGQQDISISLQAAQQVLITDVSDERAIALFTKTTSQVLFTDLNNIAKYVSNERNDAITEASNDRIAVAKDYAISDYGNSESLERALDMVSSEAQKLATLAGEDIIGLANAIKAQQSDLLKSVIMAASQDNVDLASQIFVANLDKITGIDRTSITKFIIAAEKAEVVAADKLDQDIEDARKLRQANNYRDALVAILDDAENNTSNFTRIDLSRLGSTNGVSGTQFKLLDSFMTTKSADVGDTGIFNNNWVLANSGNLTIEEAINLKDQVDQNQITQLIKLIRDVEGRGPAILRRFDVKEAMVRIDMLVGGERIIGSILGAKESEKLVLALKEFKGNVILAEENNELTSERLEFFEDDAIKRFGRRSSFSNAVSSLNALPFPRFWEGIITGNKDDMEEKWAKADESVIDAINNGELPLDIIIREQKLLEEFAILIQQLSDPKKEVE